MLFHGETGVISSVGLCPWSTLITSTLKNSCLETRIYIKSSTQLTHRFIIIIRTKLVWSNAQNKPDYCLFQHFSIKIRLKHNTNYCIYDTSTGQV
jgi:hypothetical protein